MAANRLINFRCPNNLLAEIESYGREKYPTSNSRSNTDFDQSKTLRDILISGLETLTNGEVKLDREPVRQSNKSDTSPYIVELLDRITKLENQNHAVQQPPTLDPDTKAEILDQLRGELQTLADSITEKK